MGRGAIPSRLGFAGGRMRGPRVVGHYPRFPAAIPEEGAGSPRVTQPFATRFPPEGGAVRLACVRRAASVHPEPGSNSPSKGGCETSPSIRREASVRPASSLIGSIRLKKACWLGNDGACPTGRPYQVILPYTFAHTSNRYDLVHLSRMEPICHRSTRGIRFSRYPRRPALRLPSRRD